jgi:hypothetical protein
VEVSLACRSFIDCANRRDWRNAVFNLNGLNMYEMLRSLKALDAGDITSLRAALTGLGQAVNGPRIEYALSVVVNRSVPATAPSASRRQARLLRRAPSRLGHAQSSSS